MKRRREIASLMWGAAFAMVVLNACTSETNDAILEEETQESPSGNAGEVMFVADEFVPDGGVTRTLITPSESGAAFAWAVGDTIGILPDEGSQVYFRIESIDGQEPNQALFTGGAWGLKAENNYAAYYPFIADIHLDRTQVPVDYSVQTYSPGQDGTVTPSHDYMAAKPVAREDGGLNFRFKHLGALVEVQFTLPEGEGGDIKRLYLTADEPVFPVKGTFDLTTEEEVPTISADADEMVYTITVNVEGLTAEAGNPVSVFFMMPPISSVNTTALTATVVYGEEDANLPLTITTEKPSLNAGTYYTLETEPMEMGEAIDVTDPQSFTSNIHDALTALGGTKLRFATGSTVKSATEVYTDENETSAYAVRNGDWLEVHTSAGKFALSGDCSSMFNSDNYTRYADLTELDLSGVNTANVTDMNCMFHGCEALESLDLSNFNTESVENMSYMFAYCSALTELTFGENFNTASVTDMSYMFAYCSALASLDLNNFNTANVTDMMSMFAYCSALTELRFGEGFNTAFVTDMSYMFAYCSALESLDLSGFNTANVTDMNNMFYQCSALQSLNLSNFNTAKVEDMNSMFQGCEALESLDLSNFNTESVENMSYMFAYCSALTELTFGENFNTASVTNMSYMFSDCSALTELTFGEGFDTANVTDMMCMFSDCSALTELTFGEDFNTANVTNMSYMFFNCSALESLDLSGFNTANVTDMNCMFQSCSALRELYLYNFTFTNGCDYTDMFYGLGYNYIDENGDRNAFIYVDSNDYVNLLDHADANPDCAILLASDSSQYIPV